MNRNSMVEEMKNKQIFIKYMDRINGYKIKQITNTIVIIAAKKFFTCNYI